MILMTIILMMTSITMSMFFMINPLSLGMSILMVALFTAVLFSYSLSSWLAFLIFLIYISGMLVMFAYFISLTPNLTINMPSSIMFIITSFMFMLSITSMFKMTLPLIQTPLMHHNIMYLKMNSPTLIFMALILLFTMIVVVKLTFYHKGPLRPFN